MALKLMYLTNNVEIAKIAEDASVDRIFLDLELRGKVERQGHLDTVISHHSIEDIKKLKAVLQKAQLLVRVNSLYDGSRAEIDKAIDYGADILMLPYFKTAQEVQEFISLVGGRVKTCLLCETPEAVQNIDEILNISGIDEIHVGLNDLHLGYKMQFMFQLVADGTVEMLCKKFRNKGISYGFGGVGRVDVDNLLSAKCIISEHYRLGSSMVILSRAFCDNSKETDLAKISDVFNKGVIAFREYEKLAAAMTENKYLEMHELTKKSVDMILNKINSKKQEN